MKKQIPNIITLCNLGCGSIAAILAVQNNLVTAALFMALGIFFDFFDGLAARSLNAQSKLGLELDSLADMVTSGLVPGIVMFQLLNKSFASTITSSADWQSQVYLTMDFSPWALVGLLITLASGYRLAKFNIDERQTSSFIGLPTPANALLILSLPLILIFQPTSWAYDLIMNSWFLIGVTIFGSIMLNTEVPLFALKFKTWGFQENWFRYLFLVISLLLLVFLEFMALPIIIISYILLSLILNRRLHTEAEMEV